MQEELRILEVHSTVNYSIRAVGSGSNLTKVYFLDLSITFSADVILYLSDEAILKFRSNRKSKIDRKRWFTIIESNFRWIVWSVVETIKPLFSNGLNVCLI